MSVGVVNLRCMATAPTFRTVLLARAVDEYGDHLAGRVARGGLSPASHDAYRRDLADLVELIGARTEIDRITPDDLLQALTALARTPDRRFRHPAGAGAPLRGPHARARFVAACAGFFTWAMRSGYLHADPMADRSPFHVHVPRKAGGARLGLSQEDAEALAAAADADGAPGASAAGGRQRLQCRDRLALMLMSVCALRVGELVRADLSHVRTVTVDGHRHTQLHVTGKAGKERVVPLPAAVARTVQEWRDGARREVVSKFPRADTGGALLVSWRGRRLTARDVQRLVKRLAAEAALPSGRDVTPHALRHTALTLLALDGVDVMTLAALAGHDDVSTTSIYLDADERRVRNAVREHPLLHPTLPQGPSLPSRAGNPRTDP